MADDTLRVLHVFGRLLRGGAELRTVELAESFGGARVRSDFLVLSGLDGSLDERVRAAGGDVIKCRLDAGFPIRFHRLLRRSRYDVVHSHVHFFSGVILAIAWLAHVPGRVAHFRTAVVNDKRDTVWRRAQLGMCRRLVNLAATDLIAVGEGAMQGAWRPDWRIDPRCRVIYDGIVPRRFQQVVVERPDRPVIINVASVQPLKNQLRLVGILQQCRRELPDVVLQIVGREVGDYGLSIRRAAAERGVSDAVCLLGEVNEPMALVGRASLLVLPSLWEGLPGAVLEACALGIPVLASDLPGTRELARHFPNLSLMPVTADDRAWAGAAVQLIRQGPMPLADVREILSESPFAFDRAREAHYQVWSRLRASA